METCSFWNTLIPLIILPHVLFLCFLWKSDAFRLQMFNGQSLDTHWSCLVDAKASCKNESGVSNSITLNGKENIWKHQMFEITNIQQQIGSPSSTRGRYSIAAILTLQNTDVYQNKFGQYRCFDSPVFNSLWLSYWIKGKSTGNHVNMGFPVHVPVNQSNET